MQHAQYETIIGLEIHIQLATATKLFSGTATIYGREPNTQACIIDLGLPGVLPVLNTAAVAMAIKFGLSINASINKRSEFARKNYFYPDLPKGYQISQHVLPIVENGYVDVFLKDSDTKRINITRAHLEEDSGKLLHESFHGMSGIDFNRAGIPLLEIVSAPDMRTAAEAVAYVKTIHNLVRYLEICDGNMQEGSLRCDVNVSIRKHGETKLGTRNEIKNLNSFRFIERAIEHETARQIAALERGEIIAQETRLYDTTQNETRVLRSKEEALDYRYFPDPDLLPLIVDDEYIAVIQKTLPELPRQKYERFQRIYSLNKYDAAILSSSKEMADYFETALQEISKDTIEIAPTKSTNTNIINTTTANVIAQKMNAAAKLTANWIISELLGVLNRENSDITQSPITPQQLAKLLQRIQDNTISGKAAKEIFGEMLRSKENVDAIIVNKNLQQISNIDELEYLIEKVVHENSEQVAQYRAGKEAVFGFLVGQIMKATRGKANPQQANILLKEKLNEG